MKKGLVLALALLTVFAMVGCDNDTTSNGGGDEYFVPPADWVGFSDAEMLAGQFYIGYAPAGVTSIAKKGTGFEVKIKTLTTSTSRQSVLWFNFETTLFQKGHYVSLTLPTEGGNARPTNIIVYPMLEGCTDPSSGSGLAWGPSTDANTVGEQPKATFDGKYVVGDLKMDWRNAEASTNLIGLSFWFQWDEDVTLANNDKDYVFTINTIKVNKSGVQEPPPSEWVAPASWKTLGPLNLPNPGNEIPQQGWALNGHNGMVTDLEITDVINAKYLVLETKDAANEWGYGGIDIYYQSNGLNWAQSAMVSGWLSHAHPNGQTFLFVMELANFNRWDEFVNYGDDPAKGFIGVAMFNDGPVVMMGLKNGYLVNETLTKPADATDLAVDGCYITATLP